MRLNKNAQYAILFLRFIEEKSNGKPVTIKSFIKKYPFISLSFIEQIQRKMRSAGFIKAIRGPHGGSILLIDKISLKDVLVTLDCYQEDSDVFKPLNGFHHDYEKFVSQTYVI